MTKELDVSIRYYGVRYTKFDHIPNEEPSNVACIIHFVTWYKMCHFTKMINNHKYGITTPLYFLGDLEKSPC